MLGRILLLGTTEDYLPGAIGVFVVGCGLEPEFNASTIQRQ